MAKFRKKPVVIEACLARDALHAAAHDWPELAPWLAAAHEAGTVVFVDAWQDLPGRVLIHTLEGTMTAAVDDWIIRGVHGELYPCKPDIFRATYEPVFHEQEASP